MATKIITFALTFLVNATIGVAVFFMLLVAMNGYSESDATYGLVTYIVLALLVSLSMGIAAFFTVGALVRRQFHSFVALLIAVVSFSTVGLVLKAISALFGVGVAELVRVNF